jgi:hypothetical protein
VVDRDLLQLSATSKKVDELIKTPKDNIQRNCSAAWSGTLCGPGDDGDFDILESLFPLGSPFAYWYRRTQNVWELLSHPHYSPHLAPSDYHLFWPLTTRLARQSRKSCEAGCEELERTFTAEAYLRFCNGGRNAEICMEIFYRSNKICIDFTDIIRFCIYRVILNYCRGFRGL